jgi:hypothetical protein
MNSWLIYWLSVSGSLSSGLTAVSVIIGLVCGIVWICVSNHMSNCSTKEVASYSKMRKTVSITFCVCIATFLLGLLIPSQDAIIKAYFIVEGSKVANAKNAEEFAKELSKKADNLIEVLKKR